VKWLVVLLSLLSGCASFEADNIRQVPSNRISWVAIDEIDSFCYALIGERKPACVMFTNERCIIFTGKITQEQYLGHETRHCFKGQFH
jgi:hypothetical protein